MSETNQTNELRTSTQVAQVTPKVTSPITVYIAGKLTAAPDFKLLRTLWRALSRQIIINSRWLNMVGTIPDTASFAKIFWHHDLADIRAADALVLWAQASDHLRGGLVEAGVALALGKPVIVVGEHPDYGTWQHYSLVHKAKSFDEAVILLRMLFS